MLNIAPLNYELWAVLVSPLQGQDAGQVEARPTPRQTKQTEPVSAALSGTSSGAGETLRKSDSRGMEARRNSFERDSEHPLNGPYPTDLNWLFQLSGGVRDSMQDRPIPDALKALHPVVRFGDRQRAAIAICPDLNEGLIWRGGQSIPRFLKEP
ncbi:MAG: hypothetical protein O3A85_04585 [Proteobacteria bacterium]|nr:hypothetical protein [Pseudomonadota bacterium]